MKILRILMACWFLLALNACDDETTPETDANVDDGDLLSDVATDALTPSGDLTACGLATCSENQYCVHPKIGECLQQIDAPQAPVPGNGTPYCATLEDCSTCGCFSSDPCAPDGVCSTVTGKVVTCGCPNFINTQKASR
ncbi:MAG: hypothetical protein IPJ88_03450 [Myxococcales bacterium]|nr:MAG: hypothetical protein IPJ88_03450 [Myxococcales bacterium]